jgi:cytochrome c oxidase subunit III
MRKRVVLDLAHLPDAGFGTQSETWWGTLGFIALEGMGFALAIGMYLYLASVNPIWPILAPPPDLLPGTIVTGLLLVSLVPNHLLDRWAREKDLMRVRIGLVVMCIAGILPLVVRIFEFPALHISWDTNAYGSAVWLLLGLHTTHLVTDLGDTIVLAVLMFTRHARNDRRFADVDDNAFYWDFVVGAWVVLYLVIYWFPRM